MRLREKYYHCKESVYAILPPKIVQLYCNSDIRKYKWAKYDNGKRHSKTENDIKLKNGFDSYRKFLEANNYGQKIANTIFPMNYSLEIENTRRVNRVIMEIPNHRLLSKRVKQMPFHLKYFD